MLLVLAVDGMPPRCTLKDGCGRKGSKTISVNVAKGLIDVVGKTKDVIEDGNLPKKGSKAGSSKTVPENVAKGLVDVVGKTKDVIEEAGGLVKKNATKALNEVPRDISTPKFAPHTGYLITKAPAVTDGDGDSILDPLVDVFEGLDTWLESPKSQLIIFIGKLGPEVPTKILLLLPANIYPSPFQSCFSSS